MNYITTPRQAELNATEILQRWGYFDARATAVGADGGIDVVSRDALAQVKWKGAVAGRPEVQNLVGARGNGHEALFFFAASGYSDPAVKYADSMDIRLYTYDPLGKVQPANAAASSATISRTYHPWVSRDYLALIRSSRAVWSLLTRKPVKKTYRRSKTRRRALTR